MKKFVLFAASMMLCAGLAFAQTPKKPTAKTEKAGTTVTDQARTADQPTAQPKGQTPCAKKGDCPKDGHKCDGNHGQQPGPKARPASPSSKITDTPPQGPAQKQGSSQSTRSK